MAEPSVTIVEAMSDPELFGDTFGGDSWEAWRALLGAFYGLPVSARSEKTVEALTARSVGACGSFRELWMAIGRRGGKSHVAALIATYEAVFRDHRPKLSPGEWATVALIAADRAQARTLFRYIRAMFAHPLLAPLVLRETSDSLELRNRTAIEVHTASFRKVRGYTLAAVIADEIAFWQVEGASPDREIITALRPALATLDGKLVALSSPYAKRGVLWGAFKRHHGSNSERVLVAQAPSRTMNPTLPQSAIDDAMAEDPEAARAEYLAEFRTDISSLIDPGLVADCSRPKPRDLPPTTGVQYVAFVDPAGGGGDEFTLAIGHREDDAVVVDLSTGLKGSPAAIVEEYARTLGRYGVRRVVGDRYAGRWPRDEFAKHGIQYDVSDLDRSGLYLEMLAALNSGQVELPPCEVLSRQLIGLERRTSRSGRDQIDHGPGGHDDRANAVAGLVANIGRRKALSGILLKARNRAGKPAAPQPQERGMRWNECL
ncbi:hypothetical protein ROJ8625_00135 [Roseivivax jejudonensis]|uniref:Phage Terminase n=1 Tax=Roseivivax jejudonensis TaxID=1529041 RepID=A0A1X6Y3X0_9RHOB|nr:hypothetical protein [Roseivivax jejudonensis]SLN09975.1 hypothetical protein ROJ8625_00135 [Roseivivax jejudonensis]